MENKLEKIVSLCKRRGFIFQGSEIYGGLAGIYDYGPHGVSLRNNIKKYFLDAFVSDRDDVYLIDASILMPKRVWEASGHLESFSDPFVECEKCGERIRADHRDEIEMHEERHKKKGEKVGWTKPEEFNLLVETKLGVPSKIERSKQSTAYLRGEITQGVHVNFHNVLDSMHPKLPFGIAQIGKAFRNEISPRNFIFRLREFEQMELQYYVDPDKDEEAFNFWKNFVLEWYLGLGIKKENLRLRQHKIEEKAHYAKDAWDVEYNSSFGGWKEAFGIHNRGDYDLRSHGDFNNPRSSGEDLRYQEEGKEPIYPVDIECSGGVDRAMLFVLLDSYTEDQLGGEKRVVLKLNPKIAPIKVAVFPLVKNKENVVSKAREVFMALKKKFGTVDFDDNGNIGKRYRRQDEIGTPWCVTVDYQTLEDGTVTIRDRDTGEQIRCSTNELENYFVEKLKLC